ncbi:MAG: hypothetical protein IT385_10965 [Deltaproteobacteria bacterium]|nr:hypothetical protein [Deltaproteobacteria bacterium]
MTDANDPRLSAQGLTGQVLEGRYRLDALDDATASRSLWRGTDLQKDRPVTIQIYHGAHAPEERTLTAALLRQPEPLSPGFAAPQGSGKAPGGSYVIYDAFVGKPRYLARHLTESPLALADAIELGSELARTLQGLHEAGWSHGTIGLDTLVLVESGGAEGAETPRSFLRVLDVGLAGQAAAPRGHAVRDDVVAVGKVLRQLRQAATSAAQATGDAPATPGLGELEAIIKRATETEGTPFPSMGALHDALEATLGGTERKAREGGRRRVSTAAFKRPEVAPAPAPAPAPPPESPRLVVTRDPEGPAPLPFTPPPPRPPEPPPKERESPIVYAVAGLLVVAIALFVFVLIPGAPVLPKAPDPAPVVDAGQAAEVAAAEPDAAEPDVAIAAADTEPEPAAPDTEEPETTLAEADTAEPDTGAALADAEPDTMPAATPDKDVEAPDTTPPVADTDKPKDTEKPKDTAPLDAAAQAKDTAPAPSDAAEAPRDTAPAPIDTTPAPVDTVEPPKDTTPPPVDTAPAPVDTAEPPKDTTPAPADTSKPSVEEVAGDPIPAPSLSATKVVRTLNELVGALKQTEAAIMKARSDGKGAGVTGALQSKLLGGWTEGTPITLRPQQMYYTAMRMFNAGSSNGAVAAAIAAQGGK